MTRPLCFLPESLVLAEKQMASLRQGLATASEKCNRITLRNLDALRIFESMEFVKGLVCKS